VICLWAAGAVVAMRVTVAWFSPEGFMLTAVLLVCVSGDCGVLRCS
jgi:hypothetical protein